MISLVLAATIYCDPVQSSDVFRFDSNRQVAIMVNSNTGRYLAIATKSMLTIVDRGLLRNESFLLGRKIAGVAFSPDDSVATVSSIDQEDFFEISLSSLRCTRCVRGPTCYFNYAIASPNIDRVLYCDLTDRVCRWSNESGNSQVLYDLKMPLLPPNSKSPSTGFSIRGLAFSEHAEELYLAGAQYRVGGRSQAIVVYDVRTKMPLVMWLGGEGTIHNIIGAPSADHALTQLGTGAIELVNLRTSEVTTLYEADKGIRLSLETACFSSTGKTVYCPDVLERKIRIYETESGQIRQIIRFSREFSAICTASPTSMYVAYRDGCVGVVNLNPVIAAHDSRENDAVLIRDLKSKDAPCALRALHRLKNRPDALRVAMEKLLPGERQEGEIQGCITLLSSASYNVRSRAAARLIELGVSAIGRIRKAIQDERDPDLLENLNRILRTIREPYSADRIIIARYLELLELTDDKLRVEKFLRSLSEIDNEAYICRMAKISNSKLRLGVSAQQLKARK